METVSEICEAIGRKELGDRLGVTRQAIANAVADGKFPPRWFLVINGMCADRGIECPDSLFSFVTPATTDAA